MNHPINEVILGNRDPIRGVYPGTSREEYLNDAGMNPSTLVKAWNGGSIDVAAGKLAYESRDSRPKQQAKIDQMDRGTLGHMMMLEPERIKLDVAVWTGKVRNGKAWDAFQIKHAGKLIVRKVDYDNVARACDAILEGLQQHPHILGLIAQGESEVAIYSEEKEEGEEHGVQVRGQMDWINTKPGFEGIPDLKFTEQALALKSINANVERFQYDMKMACYARWWQRETGKTAMHFTNLTFGLTKPYGVAVTRYGTQALEFGWEKAERTLRAMRAAIEADEWPMLVIDSDYVASPWEIEDAEEELIGFDEVPS